VAAATVAVQAVATVVVRVMVEEVVGPAGYEMAYIYLH
jgi:hypothetical protein